MVKSSATIYNMTSNSRVHPSYLRFRTYLPDILLLEPAGGILKNKYLAIHFKYLPPEQSTIGNVHITISTMDWVTYAASNACDTLLEYLHT